jgi:uncharacterized protein YggT (Ycf19 family)
MRRTATNPQNIRHIITSLIGGAAALLVARLVLRLLAARPDNPVFNTLFRLTAPPRLLAFLDREQPRFGATLEFSTLALVLILLALGLIVARVGKGRGRLNHG